MTIFVGALRRILQAMARRARGAYGVPLVLALAASCAPAEESERMAEQRDALSGGVQAFAHFDADGHAIPGFTASTTGTAVDAVRTGPGRYTVTFHSLAATLLTAGAAGTVQITAVGPSNVRCAVESSWSFTAERDVVVPVVCRSPGAGLQNSGFFAYFGRNAGASGASAYARVNADATVPTSTRFSSGGGEIRATRASTGLYWVFLSAGLRQGVQVTAIGTAVYCHASMRELGVTTVHCFNDAGSPTDASFTVNQHGTDSLPLRGVGAFAQVKDSGALDTRYDYNACPLGATASSRVGVGRYKVKHSLVAESQFSYQVGSYSPDASYCKVADLTLPGASTTALATVQCFSAAGVPRDAAFLETYAVDRGDCGGCPRSCQGGECVLGACQPVTLASGLRPKSVAANDTTVWIGNESIDLSGALLFSVPRAGGATTALVTTAEAGRHFFIDAVTVAGSVYWYEYGGAGGTGLFTKPLVGGARRQLVAGSGLLPAPRGVAVSGGMVYFVDAFNGRLSSVSPSGVVRSLLPPDPLSGNFYPLNIATDGTWVYFVRGTGHRVSRVPVGGGEVTVLSDFGPDTPGTATSAIATDGINVYFAQSKSSGRIYSVPVGGGTTSTFAFATGVVTGLALQGGTLFWTSKSAGVVQSKSLAGGDTQTLVAGEDQPDSLFVDASSLFWTTATAVRKLAR